MKRALKNKVKAAQESNPSEDVPVENVNTPSSKANRRARTRAAMIGLALSMGATSLLVTRQSDQAQAAEPANQNTAAGDTTVKFATTSKLDAQASSNVSVPESPVIVEPTAISQVPELGTKWQIAASGVNTKFPTPVSATRNLTTESNSVVVREQAVKGQRIANAIAKAQANQNKFEAVKVPTSVYGVAGTKAQSLTAITQTVSPAYTQSNEVNAQLKAQQEFAITHLQKKSNRLRESLAELRSGETNESLPQVGTAYSESNPVASTTVPTPMTVPNLGASVNTSASKVYEVKPGDTLAVIALENGTSVAELVKANGLVNPNQLKISQKLNIPVTGKVNSVQANIPAVSNPVVPTPMQSPVAVTNSAAVANTAIPSPSSTIANSSVNANSEPVAADATGMGGDTPVPKIFTEMQLASRNNNRAKQAKEDRGLRSLQEEIERLRVKYRNQQSGKQVAPVSPINTAVPISVPRPNTVAVPTSPAFRNRRENIAIPVPTYRQNTVAVPIPVPTPMAPNNNAQPINPEWAPSRNANNRRMATPPLTVNASETLGNMRGTVVSPQLPPLAAVDRYLPRPIDTNSPMPVPGETNPGSTAYIWPAKGVLTSGYGWRWGRMHRGIDVANSVGTPIYAAAPGVVEKSGWNSGGYGYLVDIRHPDGSMTRYGHNSRLLVQQGQQVQQGDTIALMGSTGFSTGPHTHFEIHRSGKGAVNPIAMLPPRV